MLKLKKCYKRYYFEVIKIISNYLWQIFCGCGKSTVKPTTIKIGLIQRVIQRVIFSHRLCTSGRTYAAHPALFNDNSAHVQ